MAVVNPHAAGLDIGSAAIGTPMSRFPTVKACCAWLGLAPQNDISGSKGLRRRTRKTHHRAGQALRLAAQSVNRTPSAFGAFFRRLRAKHGPQKAIGATAHQIARTLYVMLNRRTPFTDIGADEYEQRERAREIARLQKKAAQLGCTLVPPPVQPTAPAAASF